MRVRFTIPRGLGLAAVTVAVLAVMGCGSDGNLGAEDSSASPSPAASSVAPTLGAPTGLPTVDTNPSLPAVTTTTQSPTPPPGPKAVVTTRDVDGTTTEGTGTKRTQITYVTCDNSEPVSGIFIEGGTDDKSSKPYGDVNIDMPDGTPNSATTIKLTHTVLASDAMYKFTFGCGYAAGGDHDWKFAFEGFPQYAVGPAHRAKCPLNGDINKCAVDGSPVNM